MKRMERHADYCPAINVDTAARWGTSKCDCGFVMNLPDGKTCGDCAHIERCKWLIQCKPENERCDWAPSRFLAVSR